MGVMKKYRAKLTSDDMRLIRRGYIKGLTGEEMARQASIWESAMYPFFELIRLTKKELAQMHANLLVLHNRFDKLRSHKGLKEQEINVLATRICGRIDRQEKRKLVKT